MEPWYKVALPRKEVQEGRSFNPDEFAIALEQVVTGSASEDYRDAILFFNRTCFTRALREHAGMVLRRLAGHTENSAAVLTLITQFGGGKTHTPASLYHLVRDGKKLGRHEGVTQLVREAGLSKSPKERSRCLSEMPGTNTSASSEPSHRTICLSGAIPSELWNRLGTKLIPKLKTGANLQIGLAFKVDVEESMATNLEKDLKQVLDDLSLTDKIKVDSRKRD